MKCQRRRCFGTCDTSRGVSLSLAPLYSHRVVSFHFLINYPKPRCRMIILLQSSICCSIFFTIYMADAFLNSFGLVDHRCHHRLPLPCMIEKNSLPCFNGKMRKKKHIIFNAYRIFLSAFIASLRY